MRQVLILCSIFILTACEITGQTSNPLKSTGTPEDSTPTTPTTPSHNYTSDGDPLAPYAWHLENTGQKGFSSGAGAIGEDLKVKQALSFGLTGQGVKIAISDSGVDIYHEDLQDNQLPMSEHRSYTSENPAQWRGQNPYPLGSAHGTAVTGLIAATAGNELGSRGIASNAQYGGFLFLGNFQSTATSYEAKTVDQLDGNFDIFNYSYGKAGCQFNPTTSTLLDAYENGATLLRGGKGAIYIKSSGNDYVGYNSDCTSGNNSYFVGNANTSEISTQPYQIVTAAVNAEGEASSYSSPGSNVWISSAGGEYGTSSPAMISADITGCSVGQSKSSSATNLFNLGSDPLNSHCNYTSTMNGTSSAAPTLSGIVALMLEANPSLTWRDVKHILAMTATKIKYSTAAMTHPFGWDLSGHTYDYRYVENFSGISFSNTYGFGRVDASAAVQMALSYNFPLGNYVSTINPNLNLPNWYYSSGSINLPIPDGSSTGASHSLSVLHQLEIESVQIMVTTNHTYIGDIGIELTSPKGTTSKVFLVNSNIDENGLSSYIFLTNAFYKEPSLGNWTIKIIDGAAGDTGALQDWKININGHIEATPIDTTPPLAVTGVINNPTENSLTMSPTVDFTPSASVDTIRYEVSIGTSAGLSDIAQWYSIGGDVQFKTTNLNLTLGNTYFVNMRAIDSSENISPIVSSSWTVN